MCLLHYPALFLKHSIEGTYIRQHRNQSQFLSNLPNVRPVFSFFCAIYFIFVVQSGYLAGIDAFSAFRHEEDSYRRKHQLQIFNNTLLIDVHEIPLVLVMGICGLIAVDMSITNQSCIDLKLEDKSIHGFFILFDDFLQFGSMPYLSEY